MITTLEQFKKLYSKQEIFPKEVIINYDIPSVFSDFRNALHEIMENNFGGKTMITESTYLIGNKLNEDEYQKLKSLIKERYTNSSLLIGERPAELLKIKVFLIRPFIDDFFLDPVINTTINRAIS